MFSKLSVSAVLLATAMADPSATPSSHASDVTRNLFLKLVQASELPFKINFRGDADRHLGVDSIISPLQRNFRGKDGGRKLMLPAATPTSYWTYIANFRSDADRHLGVDSIIPPLQRNFRGKDGGRKLTWTPIAPFKQNFR